MAEKKRERKKAATKERKPNWQEYTASVEEIQSHLHGIAYGSRDEPI